MNVLNEEMMIKILSESYNKRLNFFLENKESNLSKIDLKLVGIGTKVTHKPTGLVYSAGDPPIVSQGEKRFLNLILPDSPRKGLEKPQPSQNLVLDDSNSGNLIEPDNNKDRGFKNIESKSEYILVDIDDKDELSQYEI